MKVPSAIHATPAPLGLPPVVEMIRWPAGCCTSPRVLACNIALVQKPVNHRGRPGGVTFSAWVLIVALVLSAAVPLAAQTDAPAAPTPAAAEPAQPEAASDPTKSEPATTETMEAPSQPVEPLPIERRPYQIRVCLSFGSDSSLLPKYRKTLLTELNENVDRLLGDMWQLHASEERSLTLNGATSLERLSLPELKAGFPGNGLDKIFLLTIEPAGAGYQLAAREWDAAADQLSAVRVNLVYQRREIVRGWLSLIQGLFRPVASVQVSRASAVSVRAQAGELMPRDTAWAPLSAGQILEPYHRFISGKQAGSPAQFVPWTYLVIDQVERSHASCHVLSGLRSPLSARRRVETLALGIRRDASTTRLTLLARRPRSKPLVGLEVELVSDLKQKPLRLVSDREGAIDVPSGSAKSPVWLNIRSGQALLAHLPFVAGSRGAESIELPDDSLRLNVEGELSILQADLVDAVARRAVLAATARAQAKLGDSKQMDALLKQLAEVPKASDFIASLNAIRLPALEAAREQKQPDAAARIQKLCDETGELIARYLSDAKLRDANDEIAELRKVFKEDQAAAAQFQAEKKKPPAAKSTKTPE